MSIIPQIVVTDVRVKLLSKTEGKRIKAFAQITLNNSFVLSDLKIVQGVKGIYVAMPNVKVAEGEYRDVCHPINASTRDEINNAVIAKYEIAMAETEEK